MFKIFAFATLTASVFVANAQSVADQCFDSIQRNAAVAPIIGKVALSRAELKAFNFLVNTDKVASDQERVAIGSFIEERQKCERYIESPNTEMTSVRKSHMAAIEAAAADLYVGSITYGEFAKLRARAGDEADRSYQQIQSNARAQYEAEENARRQAILGMLMNRPTYQPAPLTFTPMQVPKTTTSNCTWIGNQLNCNTR